jgi:hypothetical protein
MKRSPIAVIAALATLLFALPAHATPLGNSFTYQGQLIKNGTPHAGNADFLFRLYNAASGGAQVGSSIGIAGLPVTAGQFTAELDFGPVFDGTALWLDIQVKTAGEGAYTTLTPRVKLTAAPYALRALSATGVSQWTSDGPDLTYSTGGVGVLGASSPFATGRGVFLEGFDTGGYIYGFNYNTFTPLNLILESPGGSVGVGTTTPDSRTKIHAVGGTVSIWGQATGNNLVTGYQCGVYGVGLRGTGPLGSADPAGVIGAADYGTGVAGITTNAGNGVSGQNNTSGTQGWLGGSAIGVAGRVTSAAHYAGYFENTAVGGVALRALGLAQVRTLQILGADLAESFPVEGGKAEPGTVLMLGEGADGELRVADEPYSRRVAGVVSGANGLDAAVVLKGKSFESDNQAPVALSGRVWVKCDATQAPIRVGDLLTTADAAGHAMVATDRERAYGAILGKAMTSLEAGRGFVLVLVSLQ